jgi:HK97 gp10 family phage protein
MGVDELLSDLDGLSGEVLPKVGRPALKVGGRAAVVIARATAPERTGKFAESIHMAGDDAPAGERALEPEPEKANTATAVVGSTLWRAHYLEYGTSKMAAYRTVGNAVEMADEVVVDALTHYMDELLRSRGFK